MKKDIEIPKVENVYLAVVHDYNKIFKTNDWNVYLINDKDVAIEMVLIISKGFDEVGSLGRETAQMRHKVELLPAKSAIKIEFMQDEVLALDNEFKITFFVNNRLQDKTFLIKKNSVKVAAQRMIKLLNKKGVLIK